jgi:6-pyruvoyltetrahydropterin/6-carboxytetrahydropterin synthase
MTKLTFEIEKDFQFEAAHYFGHADANDLFKKIHGHSFAGTVRIEGDAQEEKGWIRDLWKIEQIIKDVVAPLDHSLRVLTNLLWNRSPNGYLSV